MKKIIILCLVTFSYMNGFAQAGQPDPSFGMNGIVTADLGSPVSYTNTYPGYPAGAFPLPDGSILIVLTANSKTYIAKRFANGLPDLSFATSGFSGPFDLNAIRATLQPDGKVLVLYVVTTGNNGMVRFKATGELDSTFGNNGIKPIGLYTLNAITVQSDGKILVAGQEPAGNFTDYAVARFNNDGSPDFGFGNNGKQTADLEDYEGAGSIAVQNDGKIVLGGSTAFAVTGLLIENFGLARFNSDGSIDNTFGTGGKVITQFDSGAICRITDVVIQDDGKIVAAGYTFFCGNTGCTNSRFALARYNPDGTLDNTFNGTGQQSIAFSKSASCTAVALQSDGKIVAAGMIGKTTFDFTVARYNTDGSLDKTFDNDGYTITPLSTYTSAFDQLTSLAVQNDGKIFISATIGSANFGLARYNTNGSLDNTFNSNGILVSNISFTYTNSTTHFTDAGIQADGKIIVGVVASVPNNGSPNFHIRYNNDGSVDSSFSGSGVITSVNTTSVVQADGKRVRLGGFGFARYNVDGTLDVTSQQVIIGDGANGTSLSVENDGKVVVAGYADVTTVTGGQTYNSVQLAIARFNADGTLDNGFGNGGTIVGYYDIATGSNEMATAVGVQSDGTVIVSVNESYPIRNPDPDGPTEITEVQLLRYSSSGSSRRGIGYFRDVQNGSPIFVQSDDKFLFGINGQLFRYNADGSYDNTFISANISLSTLRQSDGKIITGGPYFLARYNTDGTPDSSFGTNGRVTSVDYIINEITINNNKLAAAGYIQNGSSTMGVLGVYLLNSVPAFTCPASVTVSTDKEKCSAKVNNIDPVITGSNVQFNYALTGATTRNGTGSASGNVFNKGVTTVTYSLANDPAVNCSFTVTVNDNEAPRLTNIFALPNILWPANHKMRYVFLIYATNDNCSTSYCKVSVTGNQNISGDWEIVNNHLIKLRAEHDGGRERIYTVTVTCTDGAGNTTNRSVKIKVPKSRSGNTNIKEDEISPFEYVQGVDLKAYPNPSEDYFNLKILSSNFKDKMSVRIYDIGGRLIETRTGLGAGENIILGSLFKKGIYIAEVQQGIIVQRIKLIKADSK